MSPFYKGFSSVLYQRIRIRGKSCRFLVCPLFGVPFIRGSTVCMYIGRSETDEIG